MRYRPRDPRRAIGRSIREADPQVLLRVASLCDGHTIFDPTLFANAGLPSHVVKFLTRIHISGDDPKSTLFVHGKPVRQLRGIYGLDLLRLISGVLKLSVPEKFGRGSEAQAIKAALRSRLGPGSDPPAPAAIALALSPPAPSTNTMPVAEVARG